MPKCVMCDTELTGRSDQFLCSNRCTLQRFRLRQKATQDFKDLLIKIKSKEALHLLVQDLQNMLAEEQVNAD